MTLRRLLMLGLGMAAVAASAGLPDALAAGIPRSTLAATRLQGRFQLAGHVTDATRVKGERKGQNFQRVWVFDPTCAQGPCATVKLSRARSGGVDHLTLRRSGSSPDLFTGTGRFYAPLQCGSRRYTKGASVPFTIGVRIDGVSRVNGVLYASHVHASYVNRSRSNLTPCVAFLGHDAATYHGHLVASSAGPVTGGQSPVGS